MYIIGNPLYSDTPVESRIIGIDESQGTDESVDMLFVKKKAAKKPKRKISHVDG